MKTLVREIMLSRVYQLSSLPGAGAAERDPDNRLLSHAKRRRLEAEEIRDALLLAAGRLDLARGGPNFGATTPASEYGYIFTDVRRSVYTPAFRNRRLELFEVFDFAAQRAETLMDKADSFALAADHKAPRLYLYSTVQEPQDLYKRCVAASGGEFKIVTLPRTGIFATPTKGKK